MKQSMRMHPLLEQLSEPQRAQLSELESLFLDINAGVNLVSRQTAEDFERRHVLHSLALTERSFPAGATVVDWGTGGGLPGLPLAVAFPEVLFVLVDSRKKKTEAVAAMAKRIELDNVDVWWGRAEHFEGQAHYAVSRATAPLEELWRWTRPVLAPLPAPAEGEWEQGLIALKGGNLEDEIRKQQRRSPDTSVELEPLHALSGDPYFDEKVRVWVGPRKLA